MSKILLAASAVAVAAVGSYLAVTASAGPEPTVAGCSKAMAVAGLVGSETGRRPEACRGLSDDQVLQAWNQAVGGMPVTEPSSSPTTWTPAPPTEEDCLRASTYDVDSDTFTVPVSECGGLGTDNLRYLLTEQAAAAGYQWHGALDWA